MRPRHHTVILALMALTAVLAFAQTQAPPPSDGTTPAPAASVRILAPKPGEKITQSSVTVQYEITNPAASAGTPNFQIQLDGRDAVVSTDTKQDFSGLEPGPHTVVVQLVDANKTPIAGSRVQLQFVVVPPPQPRISNTGSGDLLPGGGTAEQEPASPQSAGLPSSRSATQPATQSANQPANQSTANRALPATASLLPLLSVIGAGALLGGIYSAFKTR